MPVGAAGRAVAVVGGSGNTRGAAKPKGSLQLVGGSAGQLSPPHQFAAD